jgi:RNA polymerase sigma-70 factor (ECF subfamily)
MVVALLRLNELRDAGSVRAWLHTVLRNECLMRMRGRRDVPSEREDWFGVVPGPEDAIEEQAMRDWVWQALGELNPDERLTIMLRHFSRCTSYEAIARIAAVPVGTVRSRLNRARTRLADRLIATTVAGTSACHAALEMAQRERWERFYQVLQERPGPQTYRDVYASDVEVRDTTGHWSGIAEWSAHERTAIAVGVRARIVALLASPDITIVEIDFDNPDHWPDHCPRHATFVHRFSQGRSRHLTIHYPLSANSQNWSARSEPSVT